MIKEQLLNADLTPLIVCPYENKYLFQVLFEQCHQLKDQSTLYKKYFRVAKWMINVMVRSPEQTEALSRYFQKVDLTQLDFDLVKFLFKEQANIHKVYGSIDRVGNNEVINVSLDTQDDGLNGLQQEEILKIPKIPRKDSSNPSLLPGSSKETLDVPSTQVSELETSTKSQALIAFFGGQKD